MMPDLPAITPATRSDAAAISDILIRSIRDLCGDDHQGKPEILESWLANKTPAHVERWLEGGAALLVARVRTAITGVGCFLPSGDILLNYVAPEWRFKGISTALLSAMEETLTTRGISIARLTSTKTAQRFYIARGWIPTGAVIEQNGLIGHEVQKRLQR